MSGHAELERVAFQDYIPRIAHLEDDIQIPNDPHVLTLMSWRTWVKTKLISIDTHSKLHIKEEEEKSDL